MEAVAQCWVCHGPVSPEDVARVQKTDQAVFLIYRHCGMEGQTAKGHAEYERYLARWKNYKRQGKNEPTKMYDPEHVGRIVAGFRMVDLPTIDTVDDLIEEWRTSVPPMEKTVRQKWRPPQG